jgi:hypothetical protein
MNSRENLRNLYEMYSEVNAKMNEIGKFINNNKDLCPTTRAEALYWHRQNHSVISDYTNIVGAVYNSPIPTMGTLTGVLRTMERMEEEDEDPGLGYIPLSTPNPSQN